MKIQNNRLFRFFTVMILLMFIATGFQDVPENNNPIQGASNQSKKEKPKLKTWIHEGPLPYEIERKMLITHCLISKMKGVGNAMNR